jgi:hypothetical protein
MTSGQLVSYIAPAAPATRRPAASDEPYVRPEIGFTPRWFAQHLETDFGERFHTDPWYRREAVLAMRAELRRRFAGTAIGGIERPDRPLDLLTGTFGACTVAAIYGVPIIYSRDDWPKCARQYLADAEVDCLQPPELDTSPFFQALTGQIDWIAEQEGCVEGFVNWQGVLNNAHRLRGEQLFVDMVDRPDRCRHLFECVSTTMVEAARRVHERQRATGVDVRFMTISNCLVNLVSPQVYRELLLPWDHRLAGAFGPIGVHNCAWDATPYLEAYAELPDVAYIDMGAETDLVRARELFPDARRAVMIPPTEVAAWSADDRRAELARIADELGPCDVVLADIDAGTPDERIRTAVDICADLSRATPK